MRSIVVNVNSLHGGVGKTAIIKNLQRHFSQKDVKTAYINYIEYPGIIEVVGDQIELLKNQGHKIIFLEGNRLELSLSFADLNIIVSSSETSKIQSLYSSLRSLDINKDTTGIVINKMPVPLKWYQHLSLFPPTDRYNTAKYEVDNLKCYSKAPVIAELLHNKNAYAPDKKDSFIKERDLKPIISFIQHKSGIREIAIH